MVIVNASDKVAQLLPFAFMPLSLAHTDKGIKKEINDFLKIVLLSSCGVKSNKISGDMVLTAHTIIKLVQGAKCTQHF